MTEEQSIVADFEYGGVADDTGHISLRATVRAARFLALAVHAQRVD
jgi:hypothetical protein